MSQKTMASFLDNIKIYSHPKLIIVGFLGFSSGMPLALTLSTLSAWLTETGIDKRTIGLFAIIGTPYSLKFLWSHLVNHLPIPPLTTILGKRRGWMLLTQIGLIAALFGLGHSSPADDVMITAYFALAVSILSATQDIAVDAYRIESLADDQQSAGAAMQVFGYRVAMLVSGAGALKLAHHFDWQLTYNVMAGFMLVGVVTTLLAREPKTDTDTGHPVRINERLASLLLVVILVAADYLLLLPGVRFAAYNTLLLPVMGVTLNLGMILWWVYFLLVNFILVGAAITLLTGQSMQKTAVQPFADFMTRPGWLLIIIFVILYKFGDAFAGVMTTPFLLETGFNKDEIANIVKIYGFAATLIGLFVGGVIANRLGLIKGLWIGGILQMLSNIMFVVQAEVGYNIPLLALTIAVENFSGGMGTAVFVAYISKLCNIRYTATQFALLSSLAATGRTWLSASSGAIAEIFGWSEFFIISTIIALPGVILLVWVGKLDNKKESNT